MAIQNATLPVGATITPSGGTATTMKLKEVTPSKLVVALDDGSEFLSQQTIDVVTKSPVVSTSAPNGYTQARSSAFFRFPLSLDNGNRTVNTLKIELAVDHETTAAEIQGYLAKGVLFMLSADAADMWEQQLRA